jgi:hypothetical protein
MLRPASRHHDASSGFVILEAEERRDHARNREPMMPPSPAQADGAAFR